MGADPMSWDTVIMWSPTATVAGYAVGRWIQDMIIDHRVRKLLLVMLPAPVAITRPPTVTELHRADWMREP
jgi:hypothetical protein